MGLPRMEHKGGAVATTLTSTITNVSLSITIDSATGWPTGGANGKFVITIDRDLPSEERILVLSRSGNVLTIANTGDRGVDGTTAAGHTGGVATVEHTFSGLEADDANRHISTTDDDHLQYMRADGTRHNLTSVHAFGGALGTPGVAAALAPDIAGSAGVAATPARSDHVHNVPADVPVAVGTALSEGAGVAFARNNHVHIIGAGAINDPAMFLAGVVDQAAVGNLAIGTGELIDLAVTNAKIADTAIVPSTKLNHEAPTAYSPAWTSTGTAPSLGNGTLTGEFLRMGRLIYWDMTLVWGSTTSGGSGSWRFSLPVATAFGGGFPLSGLAILNDSGTRYVGILIVGGSNTEFRVLERVTLADLSPTAPFTWGNGDFLQVSGAYIAAS